MTPEILKLQCTKQSPRKIVEIQIPGFPTMDTDSEGLG